MEDQEVVVGTLHLAPKYQPRSLAMSCAKRFWWQRRKRRFVAAALRNHVLESRRILARSQYLLRLIHQRESSAADAGDEAEAIAATSAMAQASVSTSSSPHTQHARCLTVAGFLLP
ncbi:hypothetical protein [Mesorhizobium sp.]|uniref:hypothetical protein n=1 Tax=Mesorhizobium sp. TaxID=1871066 RepID=UPI000FE49852|nr:hypothetical protein [Mesorhizobium sp.]RWO39023.1 MAG: hypothetical protein EOS13_34050 [Mesorhizobium sp.]